MVEGCFSALTHGCRQAEVASGAHENSRRFAGETTKTLTGLQNLQAGKDDEITPTRSSPDPANSSYPRCTPREALPAPALARPFHTLQSPFPSTGKDAPLSSHRSIPLSCKTERKSC